MNCRTRWICWQKWFDLWKRKKNEWENFYQLNNDERYIVAAFNIRNIAFSRAFCFQKHVRVGKCQNQSKFNKIKVSSIPIAVGSAAIMLFKIIRKIARKTLSAFFYGYHQTLVHFITFLRLSLSFGTFYVRLGSMYTMRYYKRSQISAGYFYSSYDSCHFFILHRMTIVI